MKQKTVKDVVEFSGIGLHSNSNVKIKIKPAPINNGITFIKDGYRIKALYNSVINTNLGTTIGNCNFFQKFLSNFLIKFGIIKEFGVSIRTIEHLMASLWACDIDNAIIEIDSKEVPIMNGASDMFIDKIREIGIIDLNEDRKYLVVKKLVEIKNKDRFIRLIPYNGFKINLKIDFNYGGIGKQNCIFLGDQQDFIENFSKARTFCNIKDVEIMQKHNLALGGNENNAMVFDNNKLLNNNGFIYSDEPVRHKLIDCIGDMFTCGYFLKCSIEASKTGHTLNNKILKKLFANKDNYELM